MKLKQTKLTIAASVHDIVAEHAKLSASHSKVWIPCPPSVALEAKFPDSDTKDSKAGTYAHLVYNHRLRVYLGLPTDVPFEDKLEGHKEFWTQKLSDAVDQAVEYSISRIEYAWGLYGKANVVILLEQRLDFSKWVPEGFGTGDLVIITPDYCEVLDYKNGSGVFVEAESNSQFRLYMLGAINTYGMLYDFRTVRGTVLQPNLNNYGSEELSIEELLAWADEVVVPAAKLAWEGAGEFSPGDHCSSGFCKARFTCSARASHNLSVARSDFAAVKPDLLTDEQIITVLEKGPEAIKWLKDVTDYAYEQATKHGKTYPGFKLCEGRSNRKYKDPSAVATTLTAAGIPEALIYERSLLGITAMTDMLGKKRFAELLGDHVIKPAGAPVLVPVSDKREALSSLANAISDFS